MKTYDVLERAADYIDVHGWTKAGICAAVALHRVAKSYQPYKYRSYEAARRALALAIGADPDYSDGIWAWNDAPERTKDEVTSTMRAVAAVLRAKENTQANVPESPATQRDDTPNPDVLTHTEAEAVS